MKAGDTITLDMVTKAVQDHLLAGFDRRIGELYGGPATDPFYANPQIANTLSGRMYGGTSSVAGHVHNPANYGLGLQPAHINTFPLPSPFNTDAYYRAAGGPFDQHLVYATTPKEHDLPNLTTYYLVEVIDSRVRNDEAATEQFSIRADGDEQARLKAVLRGDYGESDLPHLDFVVSRRATVKAFNADNEVVVDGFDDDEEDAS